MSTADAGGSGTWASRDAAENWNRFGLIRNQYLGPITDLMLERSRMSSGSHVLDLGTGTGDAAILAAERVRPGGSVVGTDISPQMIEGARRAARAAKVDNASFRVMDAAANDLPPGSFDAAIGRNIMMFVPDLPRAVTGIHSVLKPGAVFATTVWSPLEKNPFQRIVIEISQRLGGLPDPPPELLLAYSLPTAKLVDAMEAAGFREVTVHAVALRRVEPSASAAARSVKEVALFRNALAKLDEAQLENALQEIEREFAAFEGPGGCVFPLESQLIVGSKLA